MSASLQGIQLETISYAGRSSFDSRQPDHSLFSAVIHERRISKPQSLKSDMKDNMSEVENVFEEQSLFETLPMMTPGRSPMPDVLSLEVWLNPNLWRAGVLEAGGSACLAFISGELGVTLSRWPVAAVPAGIFFGNTALVALIIYATATTTGAHINPNVTISAFFCGLCHPVRAAVYLICQIIGGIIGGAFLRAGLGEARAIALHNGGCWLDPAGGTTVGQAVSLEFMSTFCLLYLGYGVGLDPRQARIFGPLLGPLLVGLLVGTMTGFTATVGTGYTGAGMFPGRCLGLAAGMGVFQSIHWIWWIPDIAACFAHSLMYRFAPPFKQGYVPSPRKEREVHDSA